MNTEENFNEDMEGLEPYMLDLLNLVMRYMDEEGVSLGVTNEKVQAVRVAKYMRSKGYESEITEVEGGWNVQVTVKKKQ